jgi:hypothetical protein
MARSGEGEAGMKIPRRTEKQYADWAYDLSDNPMSVAALLKHRDALWRAATELLNDVRGRHPGEELSCKYMRALECAALHSAKKSRNKSRSAKRRST